MCSERRSIGRLRTLVHSKSRAEGRYERKRRSLEISQNYTRDSADSEASSGVAGGASQTAMSPNSYAYKKTQIGVFTDREACSRFCGGSAVSPTVTDQTTTLPWAVAAEAAPNPAQILAYFTIREKKTAGLVLTAGPFWLRVLLKRFGSEN